jgi:hypothetical protein
LRIFESLNYHGGNAARSINGPGTWLHVPKVVCPEA